MGRSFVPPEAAFQSLAESQAGVASGKVRFRGPGGEVLGAFGNARRDPSLSQVKVNAIVEMPKPTCAKEVQRFIGKCQYYRKFIPNFSQVAAPLFKAQATRRDFAWNDTCGLAWTHLREALISDAILVHPDYTRDVFLDCDGPGEGLDAVLLQAHDEGEKVVANASRSLLEHEKRWTETELEAAALIWALETF